MRTRTCKHTGLADRNNLNVPNWNEVITWELCTCVNKRMYVPPQYWRTSNWQSDLCWNGWSMHSPSCSPMLQWISSCFAMYWRWKEIHCSPHKEPIHLINRRCYLQCTTVSTTSFHSLKFSYTKHNTWFRRWWSSTLWPNRSHISCLPHNLLQIQSAVKKWRQTRLVESSSVISREWVWVEGEGRFVCN